MAPGNDLARLDLNLLPVLVALLDAGSVSQAAVKLGVSQPTVSEHLKVLSQAGLVSAKRVKQWTFYKRDEARIAKLKTAILAKI